MVIHDRILRLSHAPTLDDRQRRITDWSTMPLLESLIDRHPLAGTTDEDFAFGMGRLIIGFEELLREQDGKATGRRPAAKPAAAPPAAKPAAAPPAARPARRAAAPRQATAPRPGTAAKPAAKSAAASKIAQAAGGPAGAQAS
jgi:hypothetical protein